MKSVDLKSVVQGHAKTAIEVMSVCYLVIWINLSVLTFLSLHANAMILLLEKSVTSTLFLL